MFPFGSVEFLIFLNFFQNVKLKAKGTITVLMAELVSVFLDWTMLPDAVAQKNTEVVVVKFLHCPTKCNKDVIVNDERYE